MVTKNKQNKHLTTLLTILVSLHFSLSNTQQLPADACNAVFLSYNYTGGYPIKPTDPANQPYRFASTLTVLNNGPNDLPPWKVHVGFQNAEILVSSTNAALADGTSLPAFVGNGTSLVGVDPNGLKSAIETAGDVAQMQAVVELVGTRFLEGGSANVPPLPANLFLVGDGYSCPAPTFNGTWMHVCCNQILGDHRTFDTMRDNYEFQPLEKGDLTVMYDVLGAFDTYYWVQVSISNHNPLSRLENWRLSWEWMKGEFIYAMRGAYPAIVDTTDCVFGPQGQYYDEMDFSQALNCQRNPTVIDLPPTLQNDTVLGSVPFCCRNGTLLPPAMDQKKSVSAFQMRVYKMPPDLNRTDLNPPMNWRINGTMSSDFQCRSPVPVRPSLLPDPSGLVNRTALASWQVACNITKVQQDKPKCCVTFSAFYNDSVVPCSTCACGCSQNNNPTQTCSASEPAILLPPQALLLPFDNRTKLTSEWAKQKKWTLPKPLPCGDNCGVSINWHVLTDHSDGWTARITVFNWGETSFADWFTAVELDKAGPGFKEVYSFNGSLLQDSNTTIFMQGLPEKKFLLAETNGQNPKKDPRIPGSQQSVILFSKKKTPGIDVAGGDGFPTRVLFNGEECALPDIRPGSGHKTSATTTTIFGLLTAAVLLWMH